jgi:hypothetical protein
MRISRINTFDIGIDPNQPIEDTNSGVTTASSIDNVEQTQAQTKHIKLLQDGNGVEIQQQGNLPIDIRQIKSSQDGNGVEIQQQGTGDSTELTAR